MEVLPTTKVVVVEVVAGLVEVLLVGAAGAEDPDPADGGGGGGGGGPRGGGGPDGGAELPSAKAAFLSRCLMAGEQARRSSIVISDHFFSVPSGHRGAPALGGGLSPPAGKREGGARFGRSWGR